MTELPRGKEYKCLGAVNKQPCSRMVKGMYCDEKECDPFYDGSSIHPSRYIIVGDLELATDLSFLKEREITHVVSVCPLSSYTLENPEFDWIRRLYLPVHDDSKTDLKWHFSRTNNWIGRVLRESDKHKILIHCELGISRSVTIACAFLLATTNMSTEEGLHHVRWKRREANPNHGFRIQLEKFEKELVEADNQFISEVVKQDKLHIIRLIASFAG